ncbi:hypothetical protein DFS34DRAFT_589790 [Phlyctochytrium arcticum]|nr:hypothetical protein DFS34DRAFT_589790 [Phlyctochytrium arcticum]
MGTYGGAVATGSPTRKAEDGPWYSPALIIGAVVVGVVAAPVLATAAISAAGFGAAGIVAGTPAAALMSTYGGAVATGSLCATLQSAGAVGLSTTLTAAAAGVGGVVTGGAAAAARNKASKKKESSAKKEESSAESDPSSSRRVLDGQKCDCIGRHHVRTCRYHPDHKPNTSKET